MWTLPHTDIPSLLATLPLPTLRIYIIQAAVGATGLLFPAWDLFSRRLHISLLLWVHYRQRMLCQLCVHFFSYSVTLILALHQMQKFLSFLLSYSRFSCETFHWMFPWICPNLTFHAFALSNNIHQFSAGLEVEMWLSPPFFIFRDITSLWNTFSIFFNYFSASSGQTVFQQPLLLLNPLIFLLSKLLLSMHCQSLYQPLN